MLKNIEMIWQSKELIQGLDQCIQTLDREDRCSCRQRSIYEDTDECNMQDKNVKKGSIEQADAENTLYVTDHLPTAISMQQQKAAVLFFLHKQNQGLDLSAFRYLIEGLEEVGYDYFDRIYRRCHGIPWNILETERCFLRETTVEDLPAFFEIYKEPAVTEYMEDLYDYEKEKAYTEDYIHAVYEMLEFGIWTVIHKKSGRIIGRAGLNVREGYEDIELGFVIAVPFQRQGYALEVCEAICEYAREELELPLLQAFVMPGNTASMGLLRKLDFVERGLVQEGNQEFVQFIRNFI